MKISERKKTLSAALTGRGGGSHRKTPNYHLLLDTPVYNPFACTVVIINLNFL